MDAGMVRCKGVKGVIVSTEWCGTSVVVVVVVGHVC